MSLSGRVSRFGGLHPVARAFVFLFLGIVTALGQPPLFLWYATLVGLAGLFSILHVAQDARQAAWWLWLFGLGYFAFSLRWLVEPFQVEAEIFGWMAPFALFFMSAGLSLFWGVAGWAGYRLGGGMVYVVTLSVAELARGYVLTGFPWAGIAQIWVETPVAQSLAWIGPQGLGALTLLVAALVAGRGRWPALRGCLAGGVVVFVMFPYFFPARLATGDADAQRPLIRVVQPNAPQHEKWNPAFSPVFFDRQVAATAATGSPDLIIWPETAIPELLRHADEHLAILSEAARGTPVVLGMLRADEIAYYNSLLVIEQGAVTTTHDKHHLVPFGEYMPMAWAFARLGIKGLAQQAASGFASGPGPQIIEVAGLRALPLICYEAVFPQHARTPERRPDLLLQITNDAWFGTYAGPQQHLAQARMRAIEQGLPLVRSANTGISAIVDARGRLVAQLGMGQHGHLDHTLPPALAPTPYSRTGDVAIAGLLAFLLLASGFARSRRVND